MLWVDVWEWEWEEDECRVGRVDVVGGDVNDMEAIAVAAIEAVEVVLVLVLVFELVLEFAEVEAADMALFIAVRQIPMYNAERAMM